MIHLSSQKIPVEDIYTSNLDLFPLSGPWVAMEWRPEDKSALFFLTGNRRPEQHLSSLIHYPPLHLAWRGPPYVFIWTFQRARRHVCNRPAKYWNQESQRVFRLTTIIGENICSLCSLSMLPVLRCYSRKHRTT